MTHLANVYLQWSFTGGSFKWFEISVFLIVMASSRVFPFTHSLATELEAMAEPQPNVLNLASTIFPSATLIYDSMSTAAFYLKLHHITASRSSGNSSTNIVIISIKWTWKYNYHTFIPYRHYEDVRSGQSQGHDKDVLRTSENEQQTQIWVHCEPKSTFDKFRIEEWK